MDLKIRHWTAQESNENYDCGLNTINLVDAGTAWCMDIEITGKRLLPILNKMDKAIREAIEAGELPGVYDGWFSAWAEEYKDSGEITWQYLGSEDAANGNWSYSWGFDKFDDTWYIYLNIRKEVRA